jgi:hypothetical protein
MCHDAADDDEEEGEKGAGEKMVEIFISFQLLCAVLCIFARLLHPSRNEISLSIMYSGIMSKILSQICAHIFTHTHTHSEREEFHGISRGDKIDVNVEIDKLTSMLESSQWN